MKLFMIATALVAIVTFSDSASAKSWYLSLDVYPYCNRSSCLTQALLSTSPKSAIPAHWEGGFKTRNECLAVSRWAESHVGITAEHHGGFGTAKNIGHCRYLKNQPRPASDDDKDGFMISREDQQINEFSMKEALRIPNVVKPRSKLCSGGHDDPPHAIPAAKCWFLSFTVHGYCSSDDCPKPGNEKWLKDQIKMTWEGGFETRNKCLAIIDKIRQRHEMRVGSVWSVVYAIDKITNVRCQYRNQTGGGNKGDYLIDEKEQRQFLRDQ